MSANPIDPTPNIDARLTRIESEVVHLGIGLGEMRLDMREMARKIDTLTPMTVTGELRGELRDDMRDLRGEVHEIRGEMRDLRVELRIDMRDLGRRVDHQIYYLIGSQAAVLTIVLGTMAKGFHWL